MYAYAHMPHEDLERVVTQASTPIEHQAPLHLGLGASADHVVARCREMRKPKQRVEKHPQHGEMAQRPSMKLLSIGTIPSDANEDIGTSLPVEGEIEYRSKPDNQKLSFVKHKWLPSEIMVCARHLQCSSGSDPHAECRMLPWTHVLRTQYPPVSASTDKSRDGEGLASPGCVTNETETGCAEVRHSAPERHYV